MTQKFLDGLTKVPLGELPPDSTCMICLDAYGTQSPCNGDITEGPVRLPCKHLVGSECISIWLSPDETAQNSCPYCRATFFPAQPRPYMEHDLMEDDEEPDRPAPGITVLAMIRRIGRIGGPLAEREERGLDYAEEEYPEDDSREVYAHFFQRTPEQYEESLQRARAILTSLWQSNPRSHVEASHSDQVRQHRAEAMETDIEDLANSFRTLPFREMILYIGLRYYGARELPSLSDPLTELNREQEEALFLELERLGAFAVDHNRPDYAGLSNREKWQLHRERYGEVFNLRVAVWAGFGTD
ncbi:MAG: hypothetical protein Q9161_007786 [Pseudevernia consocians]